MFSHVVLGSNDVDASKVFYDAILGALGHQSGVIDPKGRALYWTDSGVLIITKPINGELATFGNGSTFGFSAKSTDEVDAWHAAGVANGGTSCEDAPGIREGNGRKLYLAYLRDPSGNKICSVFEIK
ncbi:VOC family protein [Marinomonas transparens]|uniref:VOC family protein n=1 Tax=Marinomonas transparens TaxID=2795388 RepID=A0A934JR51_9GAMM|nr:VOC family protein [Marinomonas transparens]MBJ7539158.1 VOC family protein [Marinomonas transparens]